MNDLADKTPSKWWSKKISIHSLITLILSTSIIVVMAFGGLYLRGENPVDMVSNVVPVERPVPEYLYTITGSDDKNFRDPMFTAVYERKIYVVDTSNARIAVFDYQGKFLGQFGNTAKGKLKNPFNLVMVNNEIFVTDVGTRKIHVFDMEGKFLRFFGEQVQGVPAALFYHSDKFYILDSALSKIRILDKTGKVITSFGKQGGGEGELYFPYSIYVTDKSEIYVADSNNNRIQVFNQQGKLLRIQSGKDSAGNGGYAIPRGLAFDKAGNLYTTEYLSSVVSIADQNGNVFLRFADAGPTGNEQIDIIKFPTSVFVDDNQRIYVTEFGKSRILVYRLK